MYKLAKTLLTHAWPVVLATGLLCAGAVAAGEVQKHGDAYVVYLPGDLD